MPGSVDGIVVGGSWMDGMPGSGFCGVVGGSTTGGYAGSAGGSTGLGISGRCGTGIPGGWTGVIRVLVQVSGE